MSPRGVLVLTALALVPAADARQPLAKGTWQRLPSAPPAAAIAYERVGAWTGTQAIVFGRTGASGTRRNAAFAYAPGTRRWRTLSPPAGPRGTSELEGATAAVWTGKLLLVRGPATALSYDPATNRWRQLPASSASPLANAPSGLLVWTGREMVTWGGGCCGEASKDGFAYDPATGRWRTLAAAPIGPQQRPVGVWTGRELIVLPGVDADGHRTGGAAYDPRTDRWRTIASPPQQRVGSTAIWDGSEVLVVGGRGPTDAHGLRRLVSVPYAYDPAANRWRRLAALDDGRYGRERMRAVWAGDRLLLWGGVTQSRGQLVLAPHGLAYDPKSDRWSTLPAAPLDGRLDPFAVWTGKSLLVWGGDPLREQIPSADDWWPLVDGALYTP